jgi:hypothetical protein
MGHIFANLYGQSVMRFNTEIFLAKMMYYRKVNLGIVLVAYEKMGEQQEMELKGAIAGIINESPFDGERIASELFWYVWPGAPRGTGTQHTWSTTRPSAWARSIKRRATRRSRRTT